MNDNYVISVYMELASRLGYKKVDIEEAVKELHAILDAEDFSCSNCSADSEKVCFEYHGVKYAMTPEEIEAAYRYQEEQYRLQDARNHLNDYVFGVYDPEDTMEEDEYAEALQSFEQRKRVKYKDALASLDYIYELFERFFDCNCDENSVWDMALNEYFEEARRPFTVDELKTIYRQMYEQNEVAAEEDYLESYQTEFHPDLLDSCSTVEEVRDCLSRLVEEICNDTGDYALTEEWLYEAGADDELVDSFDLG